MTFEEASAYMQEPFIYYGVGAMAAINCPFNKSVTEVAGKILLGTKEPYVAADAFRLHPAVAAE